MPCPHCTELAADLDTARQQVARLVLQRAELVTYLRAIAAEDERPDDEVRIQDWDVADVYRFAYSAIMSARQTLERAKL